MTQESISTMTHPPPTVHYIIQKDILGPLAAHLKTIQHFWKWKVEFSNLNMHEWI